MKRLIPLLTLLAVVALALPAWADSHTFSFTAAARITPGNVASGDVLTLETVDVPAHLVGLTCTFTGTSQNDESVHVNSYAEIVTNGNSTEVTGTEDGVNGVHVVDRSLVLGPTVTVLYHVGARALGEVPIGVSINLGVGVTCPQEPTTTTSSSVPSSSTTTSQTSSTLATTTTSSVPDSSTSTTTPNEDTTPVPPTTVSPPSTIVIVDEPPSTGTIPPVTLTELPFTAGELDPAPLGMAAVALFALGGGLLRAVRVGRHEG